MAEPTTWQDLAKMVEDPYEQLEVDPARWDPIGTQSRMEKCTNALLDLYRRLGEVQSEISGMKETRSGDAYHAARDRAIPLENQVKALELKWKTLKNRGYIKHQEEQVS